MNLDKILYEGFGHKSFRTGQREIISKLVQGKHTLGVLPTGTGKTLCYQFIGHISKGHILIVSPLLSLMQDQVEQLKYSGNKVVAINSFLTTFQKSSILSSLRNYKYIFVSPEMLQVDYVLQKLQELTLSLFVVDEAHCISQWGYDFRTDYLKLGEIRKKLNNPLTLALTATATEEVINDIVTILNIGEAEVFNTGVDRPNIALKVEVYNDIKEKQKAVLTYLKTLFKPGIIYFSSKKIAEQTVDFLRRNGISKVMAYHGGMTQEERVLIQQQFLHGQIDYICATSAFGMGINKQDTRFVIHFHMPLQMESYLQEIGRAGRDGKNSIAIILYSKGDEGLALQLVESELPIPVQIDWLFNEFSTGENNSTVSCLTEDTRIRGGFTEVQWRVSCDFIITQVKKGEPLDRVRENLKEFIVTRRNIKMKKVMEMYNYIHSLVCRRRIILNYFNENIKNNSHCCDNCGLSLDNYYQIQDNSQHLEMNVNWEKRLEMLLTPFREA